MNQYDLFDQVVEEHARRTPKSSAITCNDLLHSIIACHKVEEAMWQRLNLEAGSSTAEVRAALDRLGSPPTWCTPDAWQRIAKSMRDWATTFGNLQLYWQLRWKQDKS